MKKKKKWKKVVIIIVVIILLLTGVVSCQVKQTKAMMETLTKVETAQIETRSIVNYVSATGNFASETDVSLAADVSGMKVVSVDVAVGDQVQAGDVIATFDMKDVEKQLAEAKDSLEDTQALNQINIQNAERTVQDTVRNGDFSVSSAQTEVNTAKTNYDNAVTDYNVQVTKLQQAQNEENTAEAERNQAKNNLDAANNASEGGKASVEKATKEYQEYLSGPEYTSALSAVETAANGVNIKLWVSNGYYTAQGYNDGTNTYTKAELEAGKTAAGVEISTDVKIGFAYFTVLQKAETLSVKVKSATDSYQQNASNIATLQATYEAKESAYKAAVTQRESMQSAVTTAERQVDSLKTAYDSMTASFKNTQASNASSIASAKSSAQSTRISATTTAQADAVEKYEEQLENGVLKATKAGTITSVSLKDGDTYAGGPVVTIQDTQSLYITSEIDQYYISDVKEGMEVLFKTDATGDEELKGVVEKVAPTPSQSATGSVTYQVKIALQEQNERLKIGMTARISIITNGVENVLAVPYGAVYENEEGQKVLHLYNEETKETTDLPVTVGLEGDYYVEVSGEGVAEGVVVQVPNVEASNAMEELLLEMGGMGGM